MKNRIFILWKIKSLNNLIKLNYIYQLKPFGGVAHLKNKKDEKLEILRNSCRNQKLSYIKNFMKIKLF